MCDCKGIDRGPESDLTELKATLNVLNELVDGSDFESADASPIKQAVAWTVRSLNLPLEGNGRAS